MNENLKKQNRYRKLNLFLLTKSRILNGNPATGLISGSNVKLQKVKRPYGNKISFEYDALGSKISKTKKHNISF